MAVSSRSADRPRRQGVNQGEQQQPDQARATYEQVLSLDANNKTARKRLKLLGRQSELNNSAA